ncbi:oxidoreductase [Herbaspirillum seropedicae]|jgi:phage baseplate assembly protein W|uniref:Phage P2 baseplate assembly W protein n=1 Tax=Herbaspirillum seropedicae (strain SmR1) TaxID=757424 RepID=D8J076_HERSS|nr:GPW/gp25 family protein [Herbaspirillum seropedicae]ADJ62413.1 phage P2 baseplate assembly W protein [Herbaspirillum seropedicae SmR1]AKN64546.1 oxidoreductase [Herbaspirillum seropedicae]NQE31034.1 oxidoreductase [Herbaspirillum seropedicae]UMU20483.1 oxidoreductase [Herbaspirillum seropedicae]
MIGMNASTGRSMTLLEHIRQSVRDILMTPLGTRIYRRHYGSEIPELIDQPLNGVTILRIYAAVAYRLALWEPRISLSSVTLNRDATGAVSVVLQGVTNGAAVEFSVQVREGAAQ